MNTSVASYAPKNKHYSGTDSLITRVGIAGAYQVVKYAKFWSKVCSAYHFDINPNIISVLSKRDQKKTIQRIRSGTLDGKQKRSKTKHGKINKQHI